MVIYVWLLSLLLASSAWAGEVEEKTQNHCFDCHSGHYQEIADCTDCHLGMATTSRKEIAHSNLIAARYAAFTITESPVLKRGEQRFKEYACRRCHVSDRAGNLLATNLDLATEHATPEELDAAIKSPVFFMPDFHFTERQRIEIVNAILAGAKRADSPAGETPILIHFENETGQTERQFEKECRGCHRALTVRYGGLGDGQIGPNLSGLFSEFYPKNFTEDGLSWTPENLQKWLKNPRKVRPLTKMAPIDLQADEFEKLQQELQVEPAASQATF